MTYDDENVFAKILRNEIPAKVISEDAHTLAFYDAFPKTKHHALIIPKGKYVSFQDFSESASDAEIVSLMRMVSKVASILGMVDRGYRALSNHGKDSSQEVPHFHIHLCGGQPLGPLLAL